MIYEIFIIKEGGQCLLRKSISDSKKIRIDEDLFSSFTCAIRSFVNELKETVQTIELKQCKLVFFSFEKLFLIAVSDKLEDNHDVKRKLALLANDFSRKFNKYITTWSGNLTDFNGFEERIASLLSHDQAISHFS
ncbi:MAG: hypothetical protein ACW963_03285 [Candidatus Sifarchaeia archaeon]